MRISSIEERYLAFSSEIHAEGSNTAPSYVAALNKIDTALHLHGVFLAPSESVWGIRDVERLAGTAAQAVESVAGGDFSRGTC